MKKSRVAFSKIKTLKTPLFFIFLSVSVFFPLFLLSCATGRAAQAEEYFSMGMAYYDLGKFAEAERWLNRARMADRTMTASDYNLGRIAFETGRYEEASRNFERILTKDPDNVMALRGAAYSRIKNGDLDRAERHYNRVLTLVPESADDGFNYALVLYSIKKYEASEEVLYRYPFALEENASSILLLARNQRALNRTEAVDTYAKWTTVRAGAADPQGLYEYAQVLENEGFYARALEELRNASSSLIRDTETLKRSTLLFEVARLLLIADPENSEGINGLNAAIAEGFSDTALMETLLRDERITQTNRDGIRMILNGMLNRDALAAKAEAETEEPELEDEPESEYNDIY